MKNGTVFAFIPARGGSKGIIRKNVRDLAGKPLIAHTIDAAKACPLVDRCFVSTDDPEIKEVSLSFGAEVIDRPNHLAQDNSLTQGVIVHALETLRLQNEEPDHFTLLQPTCPLRTARQLEESIRLYLESDVASVVSINHQHHNPYKDFLIEDGLLKPLFGVPYLSKVRQELQEVYRQNGAIYVLSTKGFLDDGNFFISPALPYLMPQNDSIDIDTETDLKIAETLLTLRRKTKS